MSKNLKIISIYFKVAVTQQLQEKLRLIAKDDYLSNHMILNAVCNFLEISL